MDGSPIPALGLELWLRADFGVHLTAGTVSKWVDQSAKKVDAVQGTASAQPAYLATGFNGKPTIEFDGIGTFLRFAAGWGDFSRGLATFIVAKPHQSACASMLELSNGSEIEDIAFGMWQDRWTYEVGSNYLQSSSVNLTRFSLYSLIHRSSGAGAFRIDGELQDEFNFAVPAVPDSGERTSNFLGRTLYGGCNYFDGEISEVIVYSRPVAQNEVATIESYLSAHWALAEQPVP